LNKLYKGFFKAENQAEYKSKLDTLLKMGFNSSQAKQALDVCDGDLERATNYLYDFNNRTRTNNVQTGKKSESAQSKGTKKAGAVTAPGKKKPSAASVRAGQAAAARFQNTDKRFGSNAIVPKNKKKEAAKRLLQTEKKIPSKQQASTTSATNGLIKSDVKSHPKVKLPTQMKDKSKEEQILRCTKRLAPYPLAVDTLLRAFSFIRKDPENAKYRKIDRSSAGFKSVLEGKPGAMDLIQAMNFVARPNSMDMLLRRHEVDMALLYLSISALEEVKKSDEYISSKLSITFEKELQKVRNSKDEDQEVVKRAEFISRLASEPEAGAGALIQIFFGENKIMRRFDGDDILRNVINFIGGHGSIIPEKLASREWCLVDLNQYPVIPIDTENHMYKTLQFIGCWPSGKLALQPSPIEWKESKEIVEEVGSSRGLGVGASS
jgi:hypothetical protein